MTTEPIFAKYGPRYAAQGFEIFPLASGSKEPLKDSHGLKDATSDPKQVAEWAARFPDSNIGLKTGAGSDVNVIDIDPKNNGFETVSALHKEGKDLPNQALVSTRTDGRHIYVKHDPLIRTGANRLGPGIDFRGEGGYVVAPGSRVDGKLYRFLCWPGKDRIPNAPDWLLDGIRQERERIARKPALPMPLSNLTDKQERARDALQYIPSDSYDVWVTVGMILRVEFGENGRNLWDLWSSKSDKFDLSIQARKWSSFNATKTGIGSLFNLRRGQRLRYYEL